MAPKEAIQFLENSTVVLPLSAADRAIICLAGTLTVSPGDIEAEHLILLKQAGLSEAEIHAVVLVAACFAFMNRLADGTGVTLQADRYELARELFGENALQAHLVWGAPVISAPKDE